MFEGLNSGLGQTLTQKEISTISNNQEFWLGLEKIGASVFSVRTAEVVSPTNWKPGEGNNDSETGVISSTDGFWRDYRKSSNFPVLCFKEPD